MTAKTDDLTGLMDESQRWQVGEARAMLAAWDTERGLEGCNYGTERTLADHVRNLLAVIDHVAPEHADV